MTNIATAFPSPPPAIIEVVILSQPTVSSVSERYNIPTHISFSPLSRDLEKYIAQGARPKPKGGMENIPSISDTINTSMSQDFSLLSSKGSSARKKKTRRGRRGGLRTKKQQERKDGSDRTISTIKMYNLSSHTLTPMETPVHQKVSPPRVVQISLVYSRIYTKSYSFLPLNVTLLLILWLATRLGVIILIR